MRMCIVLLTVFFLFTSCVKSPNLEKKISKRVDEKVDKRGFWIMNSCLSKSDERDILEGIEDSEIGKNYLKLSYSDFILNPKKYSNKKVIFISVSNNHHVYYLGIRTAKIQYEEDKWTEQPVSGPYGYVKVKCRKGKVTDTISLGKVINKIKSFALRTDKKDYQIENLERKEKNLKISIDRLPYAGRPETDVELKLLLINAKKTTIYNKQIRFEYPSFLKYVYSRPLGFVQDSKDKKIIFWNVKKLPPRKKLTVQLFLKSKEKGTAKCKMQLFKNSLPILSPVSEEIYFFYQWNMASELWGGERGFLEENIDYRIVIKNISLKSFKNIVMNLTYSKNLQFVSLKGPWKYNHKKKGEIQVLIPIIGPREIMRFRLICKAIKPFNATVTVSFSRNYCYPLFYNREHTLVYPFDIDGKKPKN